MKKFLILLVMGLAFTAYASNASKEKVFICTGGSSQCYHKSETCKGLCNCRASIKEITLEDAEKMGRRPCKMCCK